MEQKKIHEAKNVAYHKRSNKKSHTKDKIAQVTSKTLDAPPAFVPALKQHTSLPSTAVVRATETNAGSPSHELKRKNKSAETLTHGAH